MTHDGAGAGGKAKQRQRRWIAGTTSTQVGKACETLVASSLMLASGGRLSPFVPLADDDGLDLIFLDKLTARPLLVQVKGWSSATAGKQQIVQFDVRKKAIRSHYASLLLAVRIDLEEVRIVQSWIMPMAEVPDVSSDKGDALAIRASTKPDSRDRCRKYRSDSIHDLVGRLTSLLDGQSGEPDAGTGR